MNLVTSPRFAEHEQRQRVFDGDIFVVSQISSGLTELANVFIEKTFGHMYGLAHHREKAEFINLASDLKQRTANTQIFFPLLRDLLRKLCQSREAIYFDPPRMRIAPPSDYLTSGVSYAYMPHRDTWYGHPICAVNYWIPISDITHENCLALFPNYFSRAVKNTSEMYDHDKWVSTYRFRAAEQVTTEARPHPKIIEEINSTSELRVVGSPGDVLIFSSQQLHGTVPNTSGVTRFSIDFRTVHIDDLRAARGAKNVDCRATGSALSGYVRASDFEPLDISPEHLPRLHPPPL